MEEEEKGKKIKGGGLERADIATVTSETRKITKPGGRGGERGENKNKGGSWIRESGTERISYRRQERKTRRRMI